MRPVEGFHNENQKQKFFDQEDDEINQDQKQQQQQQANAAKAASSLTITAAMVSFVRSLRHRINKMLVFALIIYPLFIIRRWAEKYTARHSKQRQKERCDAILQSTEEYATWKENAMVLDEFAGYNEWKQHQDANQKLLSSPSSATTKTTKNPSMISSATSWFMSIVSSTSPSKKKESFESNSSPTSEIDMGIRNNNDDNNNKNNEQKMSSSSSRCFNEDKIEDAAQFVDRIYETNSEIAMGTYIRTALGREMFGLGCTELHEYYVGTKDSVEHYLTSVEKVIEKFVASSTTPASTVAAAAATTIKNSDDNNNNNRRSNLTISTTTASIAKKISTSSSKDQEGVESITHTSSSSSSSSNDDEYDDDDKAANENKKKKQQQQQQQEEEEYDTLVNRAPAGTDDLKVGPHHLELLRWAKQDDAAAETEASWEKHVTNKKAENSTSGVGANQDDRDESHHPSSSSSPAHHQSPAAANSFHPHHHHHAHTMSPKEKFLLLKDAAQSYGRTALMLSGGASLGMYHAGVVRALWSAKLLPKIISGSSAGAIIASIFCTRTDDECEFLLSDAAAGGLEAKVSLNAFDSYDDPLTSISTRIWRLIKTGAFMDVQILMDCMRANCGDITFAEAYHRTGRILNIAVASVSREGGKKAKSLVLNYVTAPNVLIWTAVAASCAYPRLFTAVQLLQKHPTTGAVHPYLPGQRWNDGSITEDLPAERLAELFNANFFIVSQVNPHVAPFIRPSLGHLVHKKKSFFFTSMQELWFTACEELRYWILKCFRSGIISLEGENEILFLQLSQKYSGSVTIRPIRSFLSALPDYVNLTSNPTKELLQYVTGTAQRRTWPHIARIETNMRIELALQKAMTELRKTHSQEL